MARKRILSEVEVRSTLEQLGRARKVCTDFMGPINGPHYRALCEVMRAIDAFAEVATGDREHFHAKMCPVNHGPGGYADDP